MTQKLYPQALANAHDTQRAIHTVEEITILHATFGAPKSPGVVEPLALTLRIAAHNGTVLAIYTDISQMWELIHDLGAQKPDELVGKKALAYFNGRKLVGLVPF